MLAPLSLHSCPVSPHQFFVRGLAKNNLEFSYPSSTGGIREVTHVLVDLHILY